MRNNFLRLRAASLLAALGLVFSASAAHAAATVELVNGNAPGFGLNDPTPVAPLASNPGTTLGAQRQIVLQEAARIWGETLASAVPIQVVVGFVSLPCDANGAVLASAGPVAVFRDFGGTARPATWYVPALANKIAGTDLTPGLQSIGDVDLIARFNINLGAPGCLTNVPFYLGTDGQAPASQVDLLTTVLHEFAHGLGFLSVADAETGQRIADAEGAFPDIWEHFMFDRQQKKRWLDMTDAERQQSAVTPLNLVWTGVNVRAAAPRVLFGRPKLRVFGPATADLRDELALGTATFGGELGRNYVNADGLGRVREANGFACTPLSLADRSEVHGRFAVVDRGGCAFVVKAKNVQDAGAKGMITVNNVAGPPPGLLGADPAVTIPVVSLSLEDGTRVKAAIDAARNRFNGRVPLQGLVFRDPRDLFGADSSWRVFLYTPSVLSLGSSVSHYDSTAFPNLLMEPNASANQPVAVRAPLDLTFELFRDLGW